MSFHHKFVRSYAPPVAAPQLFGRQGNNKGASSKLANSPADGVEMIYGYDFGNSAPERVLAGNITHCFNTKKYI